MPKKSKDDKILKQTYFEDKWLTDSQFSRWIKKEKDNKLFGCKLCKKSGLKLSNMGKQAVISHTDGDGHKQEVNRLQQIDNFFKKHSVTTSASPSTKSSVEVVPVDGDVEGSSQNADGSPNTLTTTKATTTPSLAVIDVDAEEGPSKSGPATKEMQTTITSGLERSAQLKACITWTLTSVMRNFSNNSTKGLDKVFKTMFPDSDIARNFHLGPDKLKYLTNFGIAPHFKELLTRELAKVEMLVVGFDESLNETTQSCQMDFHVRYWDSIDMQVKVRYWGSKFLGHSTNLDLADKFSDEIDPIGLHKILQISMDGPSVNHKFYQEIVKRREELEIHNKMIDIGSCGLHIIHGAFKTGIKSTNWNAEKTLRGSYQLLHDTPARRADYISVTMSTEFPSSFCGTRWVEDREPADKLVKLWPNMVKLVGFWEKGPKKLRPKSKTYEHVKTAVEDLVTPAQLAFFGYFATHFEPFLLKYQTHHPMIPYLLEDLEKLYCSVLKVVVKEEVVANKSAGELTKIDLKDSKIFKKRKHFHIGFAAETILRDLKNRDLIKQEQRDDFFDNVKTCVVSTIEKLSERCPLNSVVVRMSVVFNPVIMQRSSEDELLEKLKILLHHFVSQKVFVMCKADQVVKEYSLLKKELLQVDKDLTKIDRLDDFYFKEMKVSRYKELSSVLIIILTLSHGQADVERGFSLNPGVLEDNIKEKSVVSKRIIKDHMISHDLQPDTVEITNELRKSCQHARQRYHTHLEEEKKGKENLSKESAKEIITMEIDEVEEKISRLNSSIVELDKKFVKIIKHAENSEEMVAKVAEGNALKRKSEEQAHQVEKLMETVNLLKEKRRKME